MTSHLLFYIIISLLLFDFIIEYWLDFLNTKHYNDKIPTALNDVYNKDDYIKSQAYKKANNKFSTIVSLFSLVLTLSFFFFNGFAFVDSFIRQITDNELLISILFFGFIMIGSDLITTPFSYLQNFCY